MPRRPSCGTWPGSKCGCQEPRLRLATVQHCAAEAQLVQLAGDSIAVVLGVDEDNDALLIHAQQVVPQESWLVVVLADDDFLRM